MLMKNNFQSKAVPRGTRTIWRYLSALFLLFTLGIGQMWADLTAHVPGVYEKTVATGGYGCTLTTVASGENAGTFEVYYFSAQSKYSENTTVYNGGTKQQYRLMCADSDSEYQLINRSGTGTFTASCDWIEMAYATTGFSKSDYTFGSNKFNEFFEITPNGGNTGITKTCYIKPKEGDVLTLKVSGYVEFTILGNDNGSSKYMTVTVDGGTPTSWKSNTLSRRSVALTTGEHTIVVANVGTSANAFYGFSLKLPATPSCSTEITTQPSGATIAVGDANPELSIVATNVASYAWKESSDGTSYDGSSTLATTYNYTPSVNDAVQTKYYYCEVTSSCDGAAVSKSDIVTVNVVGAISYYTVTLNPAGGTIVDATGWTLNAGNYEKEVAEGTVLTLPTFTKTDRAFKTWRKAGPADVASPVTVDGDLSLTAIWTATIEQVIYSWEGAEGGAIETGGTASSSTDGGSSFDDAQINVKQAETELYCLQINGNNSFGTNLVQITLAGEEKVKTGDKIKYWGFYSKSSNANARPKMRDANGSNASIFDDPTNLPNLYNGGDPAERTFTVPAGINTSAVQITRSQTGSNTWISKLQIIREVQVEEGDLLTVTFDANGGSAIAPVVVASGQAVAKPTDPTWAHHRFNEWQLAGSAYDFSSAVTTDITLVANWTQLYTISFAAGDGSGDAPAAIADKAQSETFEVPANTFTPPTGQVFDHWNDGATDYNPEDTYTVGTSNVILTAIWRTPSTMYAITKGAHENGDFTIDPASQEAGEVVTLEATPDDGYLFGAWEVVKTEDASATGITVDANGQFTMPGYAVTVNATFAADPRKKILYVTNNDEATTKANDKLYEALKDDYRVTIVGPTSDADQTNYDLVVLHESIGGGNYGATAVAAAKTGNTPVLNTKSYFYNDGRWGWGAPNAGQSVKGATLNSSYCNIADHPLFDGVTMTAGFFEITDDAAAKCMQPVGSFTSGKEGYTLATTPNNGEGNGCAIHELTPAQRGASAGKYLMISVSGDKLNALNANGQKLFQNAAAYLIGSTSWEPIAVPSSAVIEAAPTAAYSVGDNIALSALAAGVSASTTYTWYKGDTWAAAETAGAIQAAKTAAEGGDSYGITGCALGDAGIYWCVISNGTDCEAKASVEVTVVDASYNISFSSAHGTAPSATTGVSYTLPELTASGWAHQGWTASVNVFVDLEEVVAGTLIANGKMAVFGLDVTFTAVWAQEFQVIFNGNGHGDPIAAQIVVDGELATEPGAPFEIGYDFGGWFTDAECTAGNEFDFANDAVTANIELYAKWTAFAGCTLWYPATSGAALNVGDNVDMLSGSFGANVAVVGMKTAESSIAYNANGLYLNGGGADVISVTLNSDMAVDTKISVTLMAANTGERGLNLLNATGGKVKGGTMLGWADATLGEVETFSYTVEAEDGLEGTNIFRLQRNNSVYLQCVKVESCGAAITYHNLTSAVVPAGKGTVALGASSVREGYTTTAEYSAIDPLYEFVSWSVSGEGASIADASANPATITIGTADAVVTLNLQLIPEKFTVNYFDDETPMGTEQVELNAHPTAAGIATAKRHYTFEGWAETKGGSVVDLNSITSDVVATINLYAKYAPVDCPTNGTIFSVEIDDTKIPASTVKVAKNGGTLDVADYVIISGGKAMFINDETSDKDAISNGGQFKLVATKAVLKVELDCALQENDIIRIDNNQKWVVSTSKTKSGTYQALTSSEHEFAVTAAWAGVDDLYFLYDGSSLSFTQIEVYRPALLTVSFDVLGHGSAPADLTDVLEGSKITAPTAPTDEDYAFAGWYKENTLENEWDFDNDVVNAATTLYAKWINKSDATLKSLKYGGEDIALVDGVYEYNIGLAPATAAVPALTAVPTNPNAVATVTDAATFDEEGKATSTVLVTPEKEGAATQTYTVNFAKLAELPQVDVTKSTLWDFSLAGSTSLENITDIVLANLPGITNDATFNSQALKGTFNKMPGNYFQGNKLSFNVEKAGVLIITFRGTNNNTRHMQVCVGDGEDVVADWEYKGSGSDAQQTKSIEVPAGKVTLKAFEGEAAQNVRIYTLEYLALADRREAAWVAPGELGTVCLKDDAKVLGANVFKVVGCNASGYMVFDQITNGEIEAGKPYLFEATRTGNVSFYKTVGATHTETAESDKGMIGTFDGETLHPGTGNYCYFSGRHIWRVNDFSVDITVPAYCCYVDYDEFKNHPIPTAAPAPGLRRVVLGVNGKDEAQGLEDLDASETPMKVMIDGTLYILRGEKVFDATGRLVK